MSDLSRKMAGGAAWMIGARMVMRLSGLINVVILARLLPPADFGVVGLTVAFIAAFEAMSDMSVNSVLVRHPDPQRKHYDTVFSLMAARGFLLAAIAFFAAEPMAAFYGDERLATVAHALAVQQILLGLINPGITDFQRKFDFHKDFAYLAIRKLASTIICVTCALTIWPDYRALVAGLIAGSLATVIASFILHSYRPKFGFGAFAEIFNFSKWMLATNLLQFAQRRLDTFILGKTLGLTSLGIYAIALELANLVATEFAMPLRRAFMPGYSRLQDNIKSMRAQFGAAYAATMTIAIPFAVGVALVAEPAIILAFGPAWGEAIAPMRVLAANGLVMASVAFCWPVIVAMGQPRKLAPLQIIAIIVGAPGIYVASEHYGLVGAAWAMAAMGALYSGLVMRACLRLIHSDSMLVLRWLPRILSATLVMALAVRGVQTALPPIAGAGSAAVVFLVSGLVGALAYPAALFGLWRIMGRPDGPEAGLLNMVLRALPKRQKSA